MKHILAAIEFDEASRRAVQFAIDLAKRFNAELTLVHVWSAPPYGCAEESYPSYDISTPMEDTARAELTLACHRARMRWPRTRSVLRQGAPWEQIVGAARELDADLIVTGSHGRKGFDRWMRGSVAERILRTSTVPVLSVRRDAA